MKPVMPEAAPAACGRTLTAPAIAFGSMKPDAKPMIICGVMITAGPPPRLEQHPDDSDRRAEHRDGDAGADHDVDAEFRRPAPGREIARHVGERDDHEPDAVFGRGAVHDGDHHMRRAADEGEEHRRVERGDQRVAEEGAVGEQAAGASR